MLDSSSKGVATNVSTVSNTMCIPIQIIVPLLTIKTIDCHTLINSGADISCIDWAFIRKHHLPTTQLPEPLEVWNLNQELTNKGGMQSLPDSLLALKD